MIIIQTDVFTYDKHACFQEQSDTVQLQQYDQSTDTILIYLHASSKYIYFRTILTTCLNSGTCNVKTCDDMCIRLTHLPADKMAAILQTVFYDAF